MEAATQSAEALRKQINDTEAQLKLLKDQLAKVEAQAVEKSSEELFVKNDGNVGNVGNVTHDPENNSPKTKWPLSPEEYKRYGRQMIVPNIGIQGQLRLKSASVLIIGVGGLGCPAAAYLAGAGVGTIGLVDGDVVETSNLHRQILHSTEKVGWLKVDSAIVSLKALNANPIYVGYKEHLTSLNAASIVSHYDLVLDCTDHPTSRYLTSDICILLSKPLISASALRTDGQLIVLNSPPLPQGNTVGGPCYRCVFPKPPPAESVVSCGDGGILGPVVGVMGVLQAGEAVRMIASGKLVAPPTSILAPFSSTESLVVPNGAEGIKKGIASTPGASMLLFSSASNPPFRTLRLRSRRPNCFACSSTASLTLESLFSGSLDYVLFCGLASPVKILSDSERITALEYEKLRKEKKHVLLDVREKVQFDICALPGAINIPFSTMQGNRPVEEKPAWLPEDISPDAPIYVVCRLGNDSQVVARKLKESSLRKNGDGHEDGKRWIGDIKGGLRAWREQVDGNWPEY